MPNDFEILNRYFTDNRFTEIEEHEHGIRFLKLRSISRKATIEELCFQQNHPIDGKRANVLFQEVFFDASISEEAIDSYITDSTQTGM